jgi:hypothetical protein
MFNAKPNYKVAYLALPNGVCSLAFHYMAVVNI